MTTHIYSVAAPGWFVFFFVVWVVVMKATVMDLEHIDAIINDAIVNCLSLAHISTKEAAAIMGMTETNFRKALSGRPGRNITLARLVRLPYRFWLFFGAQIMWLVARKHAIEIAETFAVMKMAEVKPDQLERASRLDRIA